MNAPEVRVGDVVRMHVSGRHDFVRVVEVLAVRGDEVLVRYEPSYDRSDEWVPRSWF